MSLPPRTCVLFQILAFRGKLASVSVFHKISQIYTPAKSYALRTCTGCFQFSLLVFLAGFSVHPIRFLNLTQVESKCRQETLISRIKLRLEPAYVQVSISNEECCFELLTSKGYQIVWHNLKIKPLKLALRQSRS